MSTLWQNIQYKMLRSGNKLNLLIGINVIVFLAINIPATLELLLTSFSRPSMISFYADKYLQLPAHLPTLLIHFWTPLTYSFMHAGILHILFNMLWLYWMGQIFEEYLGNKRTIGLYILGGLSGALFFLLAYNLLPAFTSVNAAAESTIVGASASVMAIVVATATLLPNYTISLILIGPVKLKWLVLVILVIDFLGTVGPNAGGEIAHLGGALFGFIYIKQLQKGHDWIGGISNLFKSRSKLKVVPGNSNKNTVEFPRQEEIDRILDKISQSGYDSLNKQEREILFRASKNEK
ncbi:Membrane associated serine protease, rhomboid family [Mucilaginibacter pineti]|uniref:Membrane associated serine protease, rhomboid family n=1 Tax=Mucilaginibacter pineti TaxID=1391627 RepID=A0A1G7ATC7_9SPHI|nr:rhomboid family intramembrane serine protease [Mucilaginibacter pineti]SDE18144.1 Membrane associated serine protease, rhomboid family [Mucilaginibacter pineti]